MKDCQFKNNWIRIVLLTVMVLVIFLGVLVLLGNMTGRFTAAVVLSGSMEPEFSAGDLLIITARKEYAVGDIVAFRTDKTPVTHRIVAINGNEIITKGDANNTEDAPITEERIIGKVMLVIPKVGHLTNSIATPIGTVVVITLALLLFLSSFRIEQKQKEQQIQEIKSEIEALKQENDECS